jgi:hypothetical protein
LGGFHGLAKAAVEPGGCKVLEKRASGANRQSIETNRLAKDTKPFATVGSVCIMTTVLKIEVDYA